MSNYATKPTFLYILEASTFQKRNITKIGVSMNVVDFYNAARVLSGRGFDTISILRRMADSIEAISNDE